MTALGWGARGTRRQQRQRRGDRQQLRRKSLVRSPILARRSEVVLGGCGGCCGFGFHEEFAYGGEDEEEEGAEGEDLADADVLGEDSGEDQAGDLGGEDDGHEGGANAAHEFGWGGLLEEGLGRDDDSGDGEADDEVAEDGGPDVGEDGEDDQSGRDSAEAGVDEELVGESFAEGVEAVDAESIPRPVMAETTPKVLVESGRESRT